MLDAAKRGEEWAFSELCRRNSHRVYRNIHRITNNHEDAEDALQTALLNVFKNLHQFDSRSHFSTWFTRIGINAALMILRKRRACREVSLIRENSEQESLPQWDPEDNANNPEEYYLQHEGEKHLQSAIAKLPYNHRHLTQVHLSEGNTLRELASTLGISLSATKSRKLRANNMLRSSIIRMRRKPSAS